MPGPKSGILLLIICSNTKTREGEGEYMVLSEGAPQLSVEGRRLFAARDAIRDLITSIAPSRDGKPMCELPYNKGLRRGPDFDPTHRKPEGRYLPAAKRYRGRFYEKLGPEGPERLMNSQHHILIVSGLYGLLNPVEQIQCYSCNVTDRNEVAHKWTTDDLLTRSLIAYMAKYHITKVFDLMAVDSYRNLIDWDLLRGRTKAEVLHGFSNQLTGDSLLFPFGEIMKRYLDTPERELSRLHHGDYERIPAYGVEVEFSNTPRPESLTIRLGGKRPPAQTGVAVTPEDLIVRMRINIGLVVDKLAAARGQDEDFPLRVDTLASAGLIEQATARAMKRINAVRNLVLHEYYTIPPREWQEIQDLYWPIEAMIRQRSDLALLRYRLVQA